MRSVIAEKAEDAAEKVYMRVHMCLHVCGVGACVYACVCVCIECGCHVRGGRGKSPRRLRMLLIRCVCVYACVCMCVEWVPGVCIRCVYIK